MIITEYQYSCQWNFKWGNGLPHAIFQHQQISYKADKDALQTDVADNTCVVIIDFAQLYADPGFI